MAVQQAPAGAAPPSAGVVGNAFVHQYYLILHQSPEHVHRFYQDISKLGRPEKSGVMGITSTMKAIDEKIQSLDYGGFSAEIITVDAQDSYNGGVTVLVTGYLTGRDNMKRKFTQSFFLAPQDKGYFVLNDIFRYVEEPSRQQPNHDSANDVEVPQTIEQESTPPQENHIPHQVAADSEEVSQEEVYVEEEAPVPEVVDETPADSHIVAESNAKNEDVPKKSYAYILGVMKEGAVNVPSSSPSPKPVPKCQEPQMTAPPPPAAIPETQVSSLKATENGNVQEGESDGHSIYLKGLPMNATYPQIDNEFKRFGAIKAGGIQIRSQKVGLILAILATLELHGSSIFLKQQGFCFGFVEFEESSSAQSAIEASPIPIGGRQVVIEPKKSTSRGNSRDRFPSGRGAGYRNEGVRGRGSYVGGRGYNRGELNNRMDYGNRNGGRGGYANRGDGYQRADNSGGNGGRVNRAGGFAVDASKSMAPRVSATA
ncbi:nuclear transport factor 2-like isoform X2 [Rhodamnia argentea]|uniref:Nuclear transport factor 2-like isoform X2 n=1 Tax=Rhodamnia argentea TaxID=178133 RepID=A0A8B8PD25_9MYRT|nr:nuclear transport factor 2-like isoform X2 [Rhodamnia argentea]